MSANRQPSPKRPQRRLPETERRGIAERLRDFVRDRYPTINRMSRELGLPHNTASGWLRSNPSVPKPEWLIRLARKQNLNLNWLLLGEGPPLRQPARDNVWSDLRETLVAELVSRGAKIGDAQRCVPLPNQLYHYMMVKVLSRLQQLEGAPRALKRRQTIASELQDLLDAHDAGLADFVPGVGLVMKSEQV
jgi:hypothetical protein